MNQKNNKKLACIFSMIALGVVHDSVAAMKSVEIKTEKVQVSLNKSRLITLDRKVEEISQGNPAIADFPANAEAAETSFMPPNQVLIRGKSIGVR